MKKRIIVGLGILIFIIAVIILGVKAFKDRSYNMISIVIAFSACLPFYISYERKDGSIRRMVVLAVMTAISVSGRLLFAPLPFFKPTAAIVIISGIYMGPESGFLVGSLSAIFSNIFFGQGPWTPFQMLSWGTVGLIAGLPFIRTMLKTKPGVIIYGMAAGMVYSGIVNIWTVLSLDGTFQWKRYLASQGTALPITVIYMVSNVIFLLLTIKPIGSKLERIRIKHGIFN